MANEHEGFLGAVYRAATTTDVAALYDGWANSYDKEMAMAGYRHPAIGLSLIARHLPKGSGPILDAGAGTGLLGEGLALLGYPHVEALDISAGMLAIAAQKKCYAAFHHASLQERLPLADDTYAAVISIGVFTSGHVGVEGLDELLRVVRPEGIVVLTVKNTLWESGFAERIVTLTAQGVLSCLDETIPYVSMPGEAGTVPSRALVLRKGAR
ncbi:MAG: class I SAM-dependent DNA methyltransferase [Gammaproteobacteria bacterium]